MFRYPNVREGQVLSVGGGIVYEEGEDETPTEKNESSRVGEKSVEESVNVPMFRMDGRRGR